MNTAVATVSAPRLGAYLLEARFEFLRVLRTPAFAVPTLLFPPVFYLLFGLMLNRGSANAARFSARSTRRSVICCGPTRSG